jgi:hypothetical protein
LEWLGFIRQRQDFSTVGVGWRNRVASCNWRSLALFCALMRFHSSQDIVKNARRFDNMRAFVQHDAFGALAEQQKIFWGHGL